MKIPNEKQITCEECTGECCKKLAFETPAPHTEEEYEDIKWYLYHENVTVYIDYDGNWMVQIPTKCTMLDENNRCKIYEKRPPTCRLSRVDDCEMNCNEMDVVIHNVEELEEYKKKHLKQE